MRHVCHDEPQPPTPDREAVQAAGSPLDAVADAFRALTTGPDPLTVEGGEVGHGLPDRPMVLSEVKSVLLHPSTSHAARDAVWAVLVRRAQMEEPAWVVGATGVALPGLRRVAGSVARGYDGDRDDLDAEVLAGFLTALRHFDLSRDRIPLRLCRAARKAGMGARYADADPLVPHLGRVASAPPPRPWGHPDLVLAAAVARGVLSAAEAELIGRTRLEGRPLSDTAARAGVSYAAIAQRRWRAERRLVAAIHNGDLSDMITEQALEG